MARSIITPAVLSSAALQELKDWLAITTTREDAALTQLLRTSLASCEGFTRTIPLETEFEEIHPLSSDWINLRLSPVHAVTSLELVTQEQSRVSVAPEHYLVDICADQTGRFRVITPQAETQVALQYIAGTAPDWESLAADLRHGIVRLAAHHFRAREQGAGEVTPPAAVAALWQSSRRIRLS